MKKAAQGGMVGVELGNLAQQDFAARMVSDRAYMLVPTLEEHLKLAKQTDTKVSK
jgi:hypothetical protein